MWGRALQPTIPAGWVGKAPPSQQTPASAVSRTTVQAQRAPAFLVSAFRRWWDVTGSETRARRARGHDGAAGPVLNVTIRPSEAYRTGSPSTLASAPSVRVRVVVCP